MQHPTTPRLQGKDWLEAQRVEYVVHHTPYPQSSESLLQSLKCTPAQLLQTHFYVGKRGPILVVHSLEARVDLKKLELHSGDTGIHAGSAAECVAATGLSIEKLHPFLENYLWKVLDEKIFEQERVFIYAGGEGEVLEVDSNSLKYVIGVINGLLAEVTQ